MEDLYIPPTCATPEVSFRFDERRLHFRGESCPDNPDAFYAPVHDRLQKFLERARGGAPVEAHFDLSYSSSVSTRLVRGLMSMMEDAATSRGLVITTRWYHPPDDEMLADLGHDLKDEFHMLDIHVIPHLR